MPPDLKIAWRAHLKMNLLPDDRIFSHTWLAKDAGCLAGSQGLRQIKGDLPQALIETSRSAQPTERPKGILTSTAETQPAGNDGAF